MTGKFTTVVAIFTGYTLNGDSIVQFCQARPEKINISPNSADEFFLD
jgi:hypothetical protein